MYRARLVVYNILTPRREDLIMTKELFTIHIKFSNDDTYSESHDEDTVTGAVQRLTRGPAAMGGLVKEVKVVDMLDCTNFLWRGGKLIFPSPRVHCAPW